MNEKHLIKKLCLWVWVCVGVWVCVRVFNYIAKATFHLCRSVGEKYIGSFELNDRGACELRVDNRSVGWLSEPTMERQLKRPYVLLKKKLLAFDNVLRRALGVKILSHHHGKKNIAYNAKWRSNWTCPMCERCPAPYRWAAISICRRNKKKEAAEIFTPFM